LSMRTIAVRDAHRFVRQLFIFETQKAITLNKNTSDIN